MKIEPFRAKGTNMHPEIILDKDLNIIRFFGKSLPEDVRYFYKPVLKWIDNYIKDPNDKTILEFNLEYYNSASAKIIADIFDKFDVLSLKNDSVTVKWYYQSFDEDMKYAGELYAEGNNIIFEMIAI